MRQGSIGWVISKKADYIRKCKEVQPKVSEILETMQSENILPAYSTSDFKLTVNNPTETNTKISAKFSAYCARSEKVFNEILKLHPKFKPKHFENSHHIFCVKLDQNKNNKVTADEIKSIADFVSKKLDLPVSVQADGETISLAVFWDVRVLGTLKFLDYNTFKASKALDLD